MLAAISFVYVFLKSFQQLNVVHRNYSIIPMVSILMAACEATIFVSWAQSGLSLGPILEVGLGGGLGSCLATYLHHRYMEKQ